MFCNVRIKPNRIQIVLVALIFSILIPVLIGTLFCVPAGDDYLYQAGFLQHEGNRFLYLFWFTKNYYLTWQGTYFGAFLAGIPVFDVLGLSGFRIVMFFVLVFFILSLALMIRSTIQLLFGNCEKYVMTWELTFLTGIFYLFGTNLLIEVFYWYSGMQVYTLPLSFAFISIFCYISFERKKKNYYLIIGIIGAFLASGGTLNVAALSCTLTLFAIIYSVIIRKVMDKGLFIGVSALIGALINAMAPGNFIRQGAYEESVSLLGALVKTGVRVVYSAFSDFRSGTLLILVVVLFLFANRNLKDSRIEFRYPGWITLYALFAIYVTDFPFVYGSGSIQLNSRVEFVEHLCMMLFFSLTAIYWGGWSAKREIFQFSNTNLLIIVVGMLMFLSGPYAYNTFMGFTPYKMLVHMVNGDFSEIARKEEDMIRQIQESEDADTVVIIEKDKPGQWVNFERMYRLPSDLEFVNELDDVSAKVIGYYGKESIVIRFIN